MAVTTVTLAQFVVTGECLTERARELMSEGEWKKALALLRDSLGMSYEQAIGVLEGQYRLEGRNDDVRMVAEEASVTCALQERYAVDFGFGGFVKRNGRMYQAYRVLDNLGFEDSNIVRAMREAQSGSLSRPDWLYETETVHTKACSPKLFALYLLEVRAMFYAARPETDFASLVKNAEGTWLLALFEEATTGIAPFWREKENTDSQAAYDQVAQYLPVSGYAQHFGEVHPKDIPRTYRVSLPVQSPADLAEQTQALLAEAKQQADREVTHKAECDKARLAVCNFADQDAEFGWYSFVWKSEQPGMPRLTLRAPKRALICYALSTTSAFNLKPEYTAFSPQGLKLYDDNPYHTDVWLGCGFDIDDRTYDRDNPQYLAVIDLMFAMQMELLNFEVQVLARGKPITGTVVYHDSAVIDADSILVLPHAGVEYEVEALKAGAVICEVGGKLAHLVTVCRELGKPIIRMDNALSKLRRGQRVTLSPEDGKIEIHPIVPTSY
jgi:phosphohistidine swiveling domain-containing protein